jgi:phytoene dehydrogenase-like protein
MNTSGSTSRTAVVVGGGPAGLFAAAKLADGGISTTLLEASSRLGGRAATEHSEGFFLNQGPHALYEGGAGMRELRSMGIDPPRWNPTSPVASVFVRGGKPRRRLGSTPSLLRWLAGIRGADPTELRRLSTTEWLGRELRSESAREAAAALVRVTTFVADHEALSADVAAGQIRIGAWPGVRYLRGGWQTLVDALAARAEEAGTTIRTRSGVRSLRRGGAGWVAELDEGSLQADLVVAATGDPDSFASLLGDASPAAPGPAAEVSCLDLGLEKQPRRSRRFALGIDETSYLSRHSEPDHRDGALLSLAGYERQPRAELERFADEVQPGWRERVRLERFLPRMVPVSAIPVPGIGLAGRPEVDRGDGLYLAGDWLGPDGWLVDAAICSGAAAATAALRSQAAALA